MRGLKAIFSSPRTFLYTLAIGALIFNGYYWVMKNLPSVGATPACEFGGALTLENLLFSSIVSLLAGIMIIGLIKLFVTRRKGLQTCGVASIAGLGFISGFFTVFCALCTIPVLSIFGLALGLGFFTTYNFGFKVISIVLLLCSLYWLDRQLNKIDPIEPKYPR